MLTKTFAGVVFSRPSRVTACAIVGAWVFGGIDPFSRLRDAGVRMTGAVSTVLVEANLKSVEAKLGESELALEELLNCRTVVSDQIRELESQAAEFERRVKENSDLLLEVVQCMDGKKGSKEVDEAQAEADAFTVLQQQERDRNQLDARRELLQRARSSLTLLESRIASAERHLRDGKDRLIRDQTEHAVATTTARGMSLSAQISRNEREMRPVE